MNFTLLNTRSRWTLVTMLFIAALPINLRAEFPPNAFVETPRKTSRIVFRVVDENGFPMTNARVQFWTFLENIGESKPLGSEITDKKGEVAKQLPIGDWTAKVDNKDGRSAGVGLSDWNLRDSDLKNLRLSYWWGQPGWSKLSPSVSTNAHFQSLRKIEIKFRKMNELVSPEVEKELHSYLLEVLNGNKQLDVSKISGNLESYFELPLFVQIAEKYPATRQEMASGLSDKADLVYRCWSTIVAIQKNKRGMWWITYTELCQWLGYNDDPKLTEQTAPQIQSKLENMAGDLLVLAEPLWGADKQPIVYEQLQELAKPAAPKLLEAMASSNANGWGMGAWESLFRSQADVDQVRPFFDSTNALVAAAAINAAQKELSPTDAVMALDKLCYYNSHPLKDVWLQNRINDLIPPVFGRLHELAKPAVPKFLRAMETANRNLTYVEALEGSQPDVDEVRPFFNSTNSFVAVAAIESVQTKLSSADVAIALEKLQSLSHPGERSWVQWHIDSLIPILAARQKSGRDN